MLYIEKCWLVKKIPPVSDFVDNNGIAKIDIIKVKLMTQHVFRIQKLYFLSDKFIGYYTWKGGGKCDHYWW